MINESLRPIIRAALSTHHVTSDQLLALLNTDAAVCATKLSKPRLLSILRAMVASGEVEKTIPNWLDPHPRFRLPVARYRWEPDHDGHGMRLVRAGDCEVVIGKGLTEAEARTCATALNALDRKVRAVKQGGR